MKTSVGRQGGGRGVPDRSEPPPVRIRLVSRPPSGRCGAAMAAGALPSEIPPPPFAYASELFAGAGTSACWLGVFVAFLVMRENVVPGIALWSGMDRWCHGSVPGRKAVTKGNSSGHAREPSTEWIMRAVRVSEREEVVQWKNHPEPRGLASPGPHRGGVLAGYRRKGRWVRYMRKRRSRAPLFWVTGRSRHRETSFEKEEVLRSRLYNIHGPAGGPAVSPGRKHFTPVSIVQSDGPF